MKTNSLTLFLLLCSFAAIAQRPTTSDSTKSKLYLGLELSTVSYSMANHITQVGGMITPVAHLHLGYRLSPRAQVQVGFAYGGAEDNFESIDFKSADSTIYRNFRQSRKGLAIPLTVLFTPFHPARRLNLFATASLIPVIGSVHHRRTETLDGVTRLVYRGDDNGVYWLATAGVVLNYKFSTRLEGYGKANLLYKELKRESAYARQAKSVAIGLNYNFNLRREK